MRKDELKSIEMKNDGHDHERFRDLLSAVVKVPKDAVSQHEKSKKQKNRTATSNEPSYIAIDDKFLVYRIERYDVKANAAHLTLYKNLTDFQADKPQGQIKVSEWQ